MERKTCLITGANSGIGKEAAQQLVQQGHHIIMACRNEEKGRAALKEIKEASGKKNVELMIVDMSLQSSIQDLVQEYQGKHDHLDVLIHNAAIFDITQKEASFTKEGIESVWATNHVGPVLLTNLLEKSLEQSLQGRIITISSKGLLAKPFLKVDLADPEFKTRSFSVENAYYQSKLAQIMYTFWLADRFKGKKITANSIYVPAVKVDIDKYPGLPEFLKKAYALKSKFSISPQEMAEIYTHLAADPEMDHISGRIIDEKLKTVRATKYSKDAANISEVMKLTMSYLK
jgi:NAD(P)-dependent dehydrogenase (short-subunit alcohol dehydrogenase family)